MKVLVLNGSPKRKGTVSSLLQNVVEGMNEKSDVEWINVYDLKMNHCIGCMKCRSTEECIMKKDDAHTVGEKIKNADALVIGTPVHWGNMSSPLKVLFDRNVPVFMGEGSNGFPIKRQKGKKAVIVTSCTTPWPFNFIAAESRGALNAVGEVLHYGGYKVVSKIAKAGTKKNPEIPNSLANKSRKAGNRLVV
ncbi:MAG TPA: flavodoxin family protein [Ignavibacteriaceae bacterium]|nr:flavodoxin family protein [Ignavibacteriaceae bacterium]